MPPRKNSAMYPAQSLILLSKDFIASAWKIQPLFYSEKSGIRHSIGGCFARLLNFFLPVKIRGVILPLMQSICYKNHLIV